MVDKAMTHPDPFNDYTLNEAAKILRGRKWVFDPFAGTGKIHELRDKIGIGTLGFEIEPEWANLHEGTICADSTKLLEHFEPNSIPAIFTAPTVGNRTSRHSPKDPNPKTRTNTYRARLGRDLHAHNTARYQYHNKEFQSLHDEIWRQCVEALEPGGILLVAIRDFWRNGIMIRPSSYHAEKLDALGLNYQTAVTVMREYYSTRGNRVGIEHLHVLVKPLTGTLTSGHQNSGTSEFDLEAHHRDPLAILCGAQGRSKVAPEEQLLEVGSSALGDSEVGSWSDRQ